MDNLNLTIDEWLTVETALRQEISRCRMYARSDLEAGRVGPLSGHEFWSNRLRETTRALEKLEARREDIWNPSQED
jgi:hypothetical protein